ncbi:MAG: lysyl oxidase family protein [Chitinophagales bacterium]
MKTFYSFLLIGICLTAIHLTTPIQAQECPNQIVVTVEIIPDRAAAMETDWRLTDNLGNTLAAGKDVGATICVDADQCLTFTIEDSFGDGLQDYGGFPDGRFSLFYDGELIARNTNFGDIFTVQMGGCPLGSSCAFPIPAQLDWVYPAQIPNNWYVFEADRTGRYLLNTCFEVNECNTTLWVYDYCEGLEWDNTQVGTVFYADLGCLDWAQLTMVLEEGKIYYIRVGGDESCNDKVVTWQMTFKGEIEGCTDETACNFNPLATVSIEDACVYQGHPNCPDGPDLVVSESTLKNSLKLEYLQNEDECAIQEGCLQGYGSRELLKFSTSIKNIGDKDYYLGKPPQTSNADAGEWEWDDCHNHWHYEGYAEYVLYDDEQNELPIGFKNGFCVIDLVCPNGEQKYDCSNQGISAGCEDIYDSSLPCQWLDVTELETGIYTLVVRVNWMQRPDALGFHESNYSNNWAKVCFELERNADGEPSFKKLNNCEVILDCLGEAYGPASADCSGDCEGSLKAGDRNGDLEYTFEDVEVYMNELLNEDMDFNSCTDLNSDGKISIADPALLIACELESSGLHSHTAISHNHCELPTSAIFNPNDEAILSIGNVSIDDQYIDVYVTNPNSLILGFELQISGIDILSVFPSYDTEIFDLQLFHNSNGKLFGLTYNDTPFAKTSESTPFFRIYYSAITADYICIESAQTVLNQDYEEIVVTLKEACANVELWSDIEGVNTNAVATIRVFPNPFSDFVVFDFDNFEIKSVKNQYSLILMDVSGKVVREYGDLEGEVLKIERGDLVSGVYFWEFGEERGKVVVW